MTHLSVAEYARQSVSAANNALETRARGRRTLFAVGFCLCALAGVAVAGLTVDSMAGAYAMIGAGLAGAVFLIVGYLTERRLHALEASICGSLDAVAMARAMANENYAPAAEQEALARQFRELDAARMRDIFGRSKSVLYQRTNVER